MRARPPLHAFAYNAWADALTGALYLPLLLAYRGRGIARKLTRDPLRSAAGGAAAFVGYALVVWAMTQASIGAVAALRECSVVFAAVIGVAFLGEPFRRARAGGGAAHSCRRGGAQVGVTFDHSGASTGAMGSETR